MSNSRIAWKDDGIKQFLDNCPSREEINGTLRILWSRPGVGFGEIYFYHDEDDVLRCENEGMSKEFLKEIMCALIDRAELDD